MFKVGAVNLDTSHPIGFAEVMKADGRARYHAVYNDGFRDDCEVGSFMRKYGVGVRAASLGELAEITDVGFIHSCNWDDHVSQALPFISRGKPVFIDKPIVGNYADCEKLVRLEREDAVILGSSSVRYAAEIVEFLARPAEERGEIIQAFGACGVDEFNYGVHAVEGLTALMGVGALSCAFCQRAEWKGKSVETYRISYPDGRAAMYSNYIGGWLPFDFFVMTTKSSHHMRVDNSKIYKALLDRIFLFMETGENQTANAAALTETVKIMLAGKQSKLIGGAEILLSELNAGGVSFDGSEFEANYAAASQKINL